jgi:hypothetical protein
MNLMIVQHIYIYIYIYIEYMQLNDCIYAYMKMCFYVHCINVYCHVLGGTRDENNNFYFG